MISSNVSHRAIDVSKVFTSPLCFTDEAIFDFANERYEANPKGLLPFRTPSEDERATVATLPPTARQEQVIRPTTNPPPPMQFYNDGLDDIARIDQDWDTFEAEHKGIACAKLSNTEFQVHLLVPS